MKKIITRKELKLIKIKKGNKKNKGTIKYIKDKSLKIFLLQHMKRQKLDFSEIKIPSFFGNSEDEEEKSMNESFNLPPSLPNFRLPKFF